MKKRRLNTFDILSLASVFSLVLTIGFHIAKPKNTANKAELEISVEASKICGNISVGDMLFVDEKYEVLLIGFDGNNLIFSCKGIITDAGFLLCGAKYLSANQPINIYAKNKGVIGVVSYIPSNLEK